MFVLLKIVGEYLGGVCLCFIASLAIVGGIFCLVKASYPRISYSILSYIVGVILWMFVFVQSILMYGALAAKSEIDYYTDIVQTQINKYYTETTVLLDNTGIQQLADEIKTYNPLIAQLVSEIELNSYDVEHIAETYTKEVRENLSWYIWKRIGWSSLFIVVGAIIIGKSTVEKKRNSKIKRHASYRSRMQTRRY